MIGSVDFVNTNLSAMKLDHYIDLYIHGKITKTYGPFQTDEAYRFFLYQLKQEAMKISSKRYLLISSILYRYVKSKKHILVKKNLTGFYNDFKLL